MLGSIGDVVFAASTELVRTIQDFTRSESARWSNHNVHLKKPVSEYLGPELGKVSFKIRLDVQYGVNPKKEADKLLAMCREGSNHLLVVGVPLGVNRWKITSVKQDWNFIDNQGNAWIIDLALELEEYV